MKCPHCQAENREGAAFCKECGQPFQLKVVCSQCGKINLPDKNFCDKCGHALVEHAPAPAKPPSPQPISFASGRYLVKKFLGEDGKKKVYLAHDTVLDREIFTALEAAKVWIEQWRGEYNQVRPHGARNNCLSAPEAILTMATG